MNVKHLNKPMSFICYRNAKDFFSIEKPAFTYSFCVVYLCSTHNTDVSQPI